MIELKSLLLAEPRFTLAVAESLTAGHVQAQVASVSGASEYFLGGVTAYALEQKVQLLGVNRAAAEKVNCVSAAVAEEMARGVCTLFGSDLGLATTGYAEPSPAWSVTVPFAWWALAHVRRGHETHLLSGRVESAGKSRVQTQAYIATVALTELVTYLRAFRGA